MKEALKDESEVKLMNILKKKKAIALREEARKLFKAAEMEAPESSDSNEEV
jgi:hypothetical protein